MSKQKNKNATKYASVRIKADSRGQAAALLIAANKKTYGRKVKLDELIELALSLVTSDHIKLLQSRSLTNEDKKEMLRQKYVEVRGPISRDEFTGFMMTSDFQSFLAESNRSTESEAAAAQNL
ncbi:MAG: hypothetical protein C5B49_05765 [Bdellovibrio sp.]|nr:MAG: hypothetical protein C5B49_05765 [Bdellovibrio sp.]